MEKAPRKQRQIRASDEEWEIFRKFAKYMKRLTPAERERAVKELSWVGTFDEKFPADDKKKKYEDALNSVFTVAEAAALWGITYSTIKSSCQGQKGRPPRFKPWEMRKSSNTCLITRAGMERLYGKPLAEREQGQAENLSQETKDDTSQLKENQ